MSSSIDYFECPQCGGSAYREQDNRTCEVTFGCKDCNWKGEPVDNEIQAYSKITVGFVTQQYMMNKEGKYICIEQFFTAGDEVSREDQDGDPVEIDVSKEVYQPMDMEQPEEMSFDDWFEQNKHNDSVQSLYRGFIENYPDNSLCFKKWAKKYYDECVDE